MEEFNGIVKKSGDKRRRVLCRKRFWQLFRKEETAAGVIEVLLILVVLIAIVILFKDQITALAELIFGDMFEKAASVF